MGELRIGLTISGAISLGAYEGGALAAVLVAAQRAAERAPGAVRIDSIAGASAGSLTGLLAARVLVAGLDPVRAMHRAWVVTPQIETLWGRAAGEPLSTDAIRAGARTLLEGPEEPGRAQPTGVTLEMALACLRGLRHEVLRPQGAPLAASTYLDWATFRFRPGDPVERFLGAPVEFALASGAHAAAFGPVGIDRSSEAGAYAANGITNLPPSGFLWYSDGGTIDNEPLGRALDLSNELDDDHADPLPADGRRLHLLVSPHPEAPPDAASLEWADPHDRPTWGQTLVRVLEIIRTQSLHEDLRRVESTNRRLARVSRLQDALAELVADRPDAAGLLRELLGEWGHPGHEEDDLAGLVGCALGVATGLRGKRPVSVEILTPELVLAPGERVEDVLSGEIVGHFGGFLDERLRSSDFALGYRSARAWLEHPERGLTALGVDPGLAADMAGAAAARYDPRWERGTGGMTVSGLPWRARARLGRLAARAARIGLTDLVRPARR